MPVVGVYAYDILPRACGKPFIDCVCVSAVDFSIDDVDSRVRVGAGNLHRVIGRGVVDNDDLDPVAAFERQNAVQAIAQVAAVVVTWNYEADERMTHLTTTLSCVAFVGMPDTDVGECTCSRSILTRTRYRTPSSSKNA